MMRIDKVSFLGEHIVLNDKAHIARNTQTECIRPGDDIDVKGSIAYWKPKNSRTGGIPFEVYSD